MAESNGTVPMTTQQRILLILDLDETLIHATEERLRMPDFVVLKRYLASIHSVANVRKLEKRGWRQARLAP
jgi:hypothetical protein